LIHELVKQTKFFVTFIVPGSQNSKAVSF